MATPRRRKFFDQPWLLYVGELDESGEPPPADGPAGGEWRVIFGRNKGTDFSLEAVGLVVPKDVRAGRGPYLAIDDEILQLWYIAVSHRHSTLRIERHWRPGTGVADSEHGVKRPATGEEMRTERAILKLAWSLLENVELRGRPEKIKKGSPEAAKKEQVKVKQEIRQKLRYGQAFNRCDIEFAVYGVEQKGKFLARKIAPAQYSELESAVLRANPDLPKEKRRNTRRPV